MLCIINFYYFCTLNGTMAEWLGRGLQNLLQRFESAWYLIIKAAIKAAFIICD
jgi:hypothetical protein